MMGELWNMVSFIKYLQINNEFENAACYVFIFKWICLITVRIPKAKGYIMLLPLKSN